MEAQTLSGTETMVNNADMDQQRETFKETLQEVHDAINSLAYTVNYERVDQAILFTLETCLHRLKSIEDLVDSQGLDKTLYLAVFGQDNLEFLHAALEPYVQNGDPEGKSGEMLSGMSKFLAFGFKAILNELEEQDKMQAQE